MAEKGMNRNAQRSIRLLKEAFMELLAEKPYESITVSDVARKADLNRGTFYAHYASVHDLLMQMEDEMLAEINEVLSSLLPADGGEVSSLRISTELFQCLKDNNVFVGEIYTHLGFNKEEREGLEIAARELLEFIEKQ